MSDPQTQPQQVVPTLTPTGGIAPGLHHIHPAYVVINSVRWLVGLLIAAVVGIAPNLPPLLETLEEQGFGSSLLVIIVPICVVVLVFALVAFFAFIYYKRFLWEITAAELHIYSGIIFKQQVHIPFQRVQSIDFKAGLIERVLGLVRLTVETAGGATNKGVQIPALKLNQAEALRSEVFARKRAAHGSTLISAPSTSPLPPEIPILGHLSDTAHPQQPPLVTAVPGQAQNDGSLTREMEDSLAGVRGILAEDYNETAPIEFEYGLTLKEVILSAISNDHHYLAVLVIVGFLTQIPQYLSLAGSHISNEFERLTEMLKAQALPFLIGMGLALFVAVLLLSVIKSAISFGGFKARRRDGRIEVERGLLQRQYKSVSITRIQSVEVKRGFLRRLIGYAEINLLTVDSANDSQANNGQSATEGLLAHPFVRYSQVDALLAKLLPEFSQRPVAGELKPLPHIALRRAFIRRAVLPNLVIAAALLAAHYLFGGKLEQHWWIGIWTLFTVLLLLSAVGSVLWYRHAGYAYNAAMIAIRQGGYGLKTSYIPRGKIQFATTHENPMQHLAQVASISVRTAAGVGGTTTTLRDLDAAEAAGYLEWARPSTRNQALGQYGTEPA
ncbi:MAG: PH domain-containing protein [Propionibacteriaceae bacterium]|jgi:putative membrane protein|nr:PH domain-containing protein [Propionibacteriaceae bacterium]